MQPKISLPISPLEWEVADSYVLNEVEEPEPLAPEATDERAARLWTWRTKGVLRPRGATLVSLSPGTYIMPVGDTKRRGYPVGENNIFLDLANTVESVPIHRMDLAKSSTRALEFARNWGLPWTAPAPPGLALPEFIVAARRMRELLKVAEEDKCRVPIDKIWRRLNKGALLDGKGRLCARSLIAHCYLEIVCVSQAGLKFYSCANRRCDAFALQRNPGERGRSHKYCSATCRKAGERERARQAARRTVKP
jgi:hypothetical protein